MGCAVFGVSVSILNMEGWGRVVFDENSKEMREGVVLLFGEEFLRRREERV